MPKHPTEMKLTANGFGRKTELYELHLKARTVTVAPNVGRTRKRKTELYELHPKGRIVAVTQARNNGWSVPQTQLTSSDMTNVQNNNNSTIHILHQPSTSLLVTLLLYEYLQYTSVKRDCISTVTLHRMSKTWH